MRMPVLKLGRHTGKLLIGIAAALFLLAGLAAWQVPKLARKALTENVAELIGRKVAVGAISFNPFTLTLHAHELTIDQPQAAPLLQVGEIDLSVAWRSIVMFAPVIDMIRIDQPKLALVRRDTTHFNFSDIVDRIASMSAGKPAKPAAAKTGLPRFSLNNMSLTRGVISLDDRVTGRQQVLDQLTLGIPFLSTFGYATHIDVQPKVHLRINGSPFDLSGTARPFDKVPASTLNVVFSGLALEKWADFWPLPQTLPIKINRALLDSNLQLRFEQPVDAPPRVRVLGDLGLRQLDVAEASGAPLLNWDDLLFQGIAVDLAARTASVGQVTLSGPRVQVHRDARQLNWQRVADGFAKLGGPSPAAPPPDQALAAKAGGNLPPVSGQAPPDPVAPAAWKISIDDVKVNDGQIHLRDDPSGLDYPLNGLAAEVEHIDVPQAADQPMHAWLNMDNPLDGSWLRARAPVVLQPLSIKAHIQLGNLALAPFAAAVRHIAPVIVQSGRLALDGKIQVAGAQIQASDVKLGLTQLAVRDESVKPGVNLSVGSLALAADRLGLDATPANFTLHADGIQQHGTLALKGSLVPEPLSVKTSVDLANFDMASLAPYIASSLNATVRSVAVGARGNAEFAAAHGIAPMKLDWKGAVDVNDVDLEDRVNHAEFLNWKHLGLNKMHISMAGKKLGLGLGDILLEDFYGDILLNNQAHLNVTDILVDKGKAAGSITQDTQTRRDQGGAAAQQARPEPTRASVPASGNAPDISIDSVTLRRGRMTFNDHFVRPNYRAELSSIDGSLTAVSSVRPAPARVKVTGRVYGTAPLLVSGTVQPFSTYLALDIKASAKGVDLPKFTTYSSKYVGYAIERGKLSVDLQYQIKDRALQASNKVLLNQLTFGKPSNSPDALKLPVLLAVALLKDSDGNIDIDLPISGSLDDPQFSVGGIILHVLMNTLVKAVTSPFKLLAAAFGSGADLSHVDFAPGSSVLDDQAKSSVATLVKALTDRPALQLDIIGRADPQADAQGWIDDQMRALKAKDMGGHGKAVDPRSLTLTDADRSKYLEKVYDNTKIQDKPRNIIGLAKSLPPEQMNALLLKAAPMSRQRLTRLADARAQAVYEQFLETAPNLTNRIFVVASKPDAQGIDGGDKATRVDFALH